MVQAQSQFEAFSEEDKEIREFNQQLPFGITKVQVIGATAEVNDNGKEFIEVGVVDENGVEDSVLFWFVGGARNISFNTLRDIIVHNVESEEGKQKARDFVDKTRDISDLAQILADRTAGGEAWFTKYYDAKGRTFTNEFGTFKSVNKSLLGYEPKLRPELMPKPGDDNAEITKDNVAETFPDAEPFPSAAIPKDDEWV